MFSVLAFLASVAVASIVFILLKGGTRRFVRNRLRYVDAVQKGSAPYLAGGAVFLASLVIVAVLPLVGLGTAVTVALAVGTGVAAGARDIRNGTLPIVYGR